MTDTSESENRQLLNRIRLSRPPLRLVIPIAVVSLLIVGAGTVLVLAQDSGGAGLASQNTSVANESVKTITVAPNGSYTFEPGTEDPLQIESGTTVKFVWKSDHHNIIVGDQPEGADWTGHKQLESAGYSTTHTFTTNGTYVFYSQPYKSLGMTGEIVVGQPETPTGPIVTPGQVDENESNARPDVSNGSVGTMEAVTVAVGPEGELKFEPSGDDPLVIESGTTVRFVWESGGHNINVKDQPEGANWKGHLPIENAGYSTTHTFNETGVYEFACEPHESVGQTGTIVVVDNNSSK